MTVSGIKDLWDETAERYATFEPSYYPSRLKFSLLRKFVTSQSRCLDVGIANGIFSIPLAEHVDHIDGIDISDKMLEKCQFEVDNLSIDNISLHIQSADDLKFEDETFDLAFSFATLALVQDIEKALSEIKRTLKPGGIAILDITGRNNLSRVHWERYYRSIGHFGIRSFTLPEYQLLIDSLGFEILENHSIGILDQWKYIPGLNKFKFLEKLTHSKNAFPDFDARVSDLFPELANHWITVIKKK